MLNRKSRIFIAGHKGMVGSAIKRKLLEKGYKNLITIERKKLDLINQDQTYKFLKKYKPNFVILAAAKVGGIVANTKFKDKFLFENLQIQNNITPPPTKTCGVGSSPSKKIAVDNPVKGNKSITGITL